MLVTPYRAMMLGDIVGLAGRDFMIKALPGLRQRYQPQLVCANAENTSGGFGLGAEDAAALLGSGIDCLTSGNHIWEKPGVAELLAAEPRLLRPHNYPAGAPGSGLYSCTRGGAEWVVVNLQGRESMTPLDSPFSVADQLLAGLPEPEGPRCILVDFHAESYTEKEALAFYLDGRVGALAGTHTHIQTADERILPKGTGYLGDLGMCGPLHSVIGSAVAFSLQRCISQMPIKMQPAEGPCQLTGALFDFDPSGRCISVRRLLLAEAELASLAGAAS